MTNYYQDNTNSGIYRFWYWTQVGLIGLMILTGFEIHGMLRIFGFELAITIHKFFFIGLLILYPILFLGSLIINTWRNKLNTIDNLSVIHKPILRRMVWSVGVIFFLIQAGTGVLYFSYNYWASPDFILSLRAVAYIHTLGALMISAYMIIHIYLTCVYPKLSQRTSDL